MAIVFGVVLALTRFGRYTYAVGSNEEAARRAGVAVDRHLIKVYGLAGTLSGLAGFMSLARFATTTIGGHDTDNLQAIAAVVIGGTSLFGGIGTMLGTVFGVFIPAVLHQRLRDRRRPAVLAAGRRRRRADRRRLPRPVAPPVAAPAVTHVPTAGGGGSHHHGTQRPRCVAFLPARRSRSWPRRVRRDDNGGLVRARAPAASSGKKNYNMTLIAGVKGDEFYITMNCGAQAEAKKLGVTLNFQGPDQFDAAQQTPIVNAVAAKKPDAVLIAPTDTKAMFAPIKQLAEGGTKVVFVDTTLDQPDMAVSQIASDNVGGGKTAASTIAKLVGGSGKVFVVNVKPGISTTDQRAQGFEDGAKAAGLTYVGQQYSNNDPAKAAAIVKAELPKDPDLKGIFATNLFSAEGAAAGLREAGKTDQVKIVGFDAGPQQVQSSRTARCRR